MYSILYNIEYSIVYCEIQDFYFLPIYRFIMYDYYRNLGNTNQGYFRELPFDKTRFPV